MKCGQCGSELNDDYVERLRAEGWTGDIVCSDACQEDSIDDEMEVAV